MAQWWTKQSPDAPEHGPYTADEIRCMVAEQKVGRPTLLRRGTNGDWRRAEEYEGLYTSTDDGAAQTPPTSVVRQNPIPRNSIPKLRLELAENESQQDQNNGLAAAGLVVSLFAFFTCGLLSPLGLLLSLVALRKRPRDLAVAGCILGGIGSVMALAILPFIYVLVALGEW